MQLFRLSVSFLTPLPVGPKMYEPGDLARSSVFFPLVGLGMGVVLRGLHPVTLRVVGDSLFAAWVTLGVWVALTRGFHIDGVADVFDALFAPSEEKVAILKDPRVGTFGVLGVLFTLGTKGFALAHLSGDFFPLLFAPLLGRTVALLFGAFFVPIPRKTPGLAEEFVGQVSPLLFLLWALGIGVLGFFLRGWDAVLKTLVTFGIMFTLGRGIARIFGGLNGDAVGAGVEWGETVWLLLWWK